MKQTELKGIITPILTPMNADESINTDEQRGGAGEHRNDDNKIDIAEYFQPCAGRGDALHQRRDGKRGQNCRCDQRGQDDGGAAADERGDVEEVPAEKGEDAHGEYLH